MLARHRASLGLSVALLLSCSDDSADPTGAGGGTTSSGADTSASSSGGVAGTVQASGPFSAPVP
jgi:hypothetical protein